MPKEKVAEVPFIDLKPQYQSLAFEIDKAMAGVLESSAFILGSEVTCFEQEFASYCDTEFAVGVDSGTSALELALRAFGIGAGDEVITAANTFIATALAISDTHSFAAGIPGAGLYKRGFSDNRNGC